MFKITITETSTNKSFGVVYATNIMCTDGKCRVSSTLGDVYIYDLDKYSIDVSNDATQSKRGINIEQGIDNSIKAYEDIVKGKSEEINK